MADTNGIPADGDYMQFGDIRLKTPLLSVKRTDKKNDTLVVPDNFIDAILKFFDHENLEYTIIEEPTLYPADKIAEGLAAYEDYDAGFSTDAVLLISKFDAKALFEWSKQLTGDDMDPSYIAYRKDQKRKYEDYYQRYEAY